MARIEPTNRPKNRKSHMMWFFGELVVFAVFVVFCRACGFLSALWFFAELVDLCSKVVIKVKSLKDLTTGAKSC